MKAIENSFGGNICRCTGYRPILAAFKSLAKDASEDLFQKCSMADIEDIPLCKEKSDCEGKCKRKMLDIYKQGSLIYNLGKSRWVKVFAINEIFDVLKESPDVSYMLVGGNTASGMLHAD